MFINFKNGKKEGITLVEVLIVIIVISVLVGLMTLAMPDIIKKANRTVDESDVRNLNSATSSYKTLKRLNGNSDVFEGLNTDLERMLALYDTHHISNIPVPNIKGTAFNWEIASQKWVISGDMTPSEPEGPVAGGNVVGSSEIQFGTNYWANSIIKYTGSHKDIIIPNMINGVRVDMIQQEAFKDKGLTSVVIEEGVTRIHARAFQGNDLTEIILPGSIKNIDHRAFLDNDIKKITIGAGVTLETNVFSNNYDSFKSAYAAGGAGTYIYTNGQWIKQ